MSYEIFYERRFIRVDDRYIPIVQAGSNNCTEYSYLTGKEVPEKNWTVLNYPKHEKFLFTKEELIQLYSGTEYDGSYHKSRYSYHEDFRKWLINGIKSALTVEKTLELRNYIEVRYTDDTGNYVSKEIKDEETLLLSIAKHSSSGFSVGYENRDYRPKRRRHSTPQPKDYSKGFFILEINAGYFYKLTKYGYRYSIFAESAKRFLTEKQATSYIKKYQDRIGSFTPKFIPPLNQV